MFSLSFSLTFYIYYIKNLQLFQNLKRVKFCVRCSCLSNFGGRSAQLLQLQLLLKFDSCFCSWFLGLKFDTAPPAANDCENLTKFVKFHRSVNCEQIVNKTEKALTTASRHGKMGREALRRKKVGLKFDKLDVKRLNYDKKIKDLVLDISSHFFVLSFALYENVFFY